MAVKVKELPRNGYKSARIPITSYISPGADTPQRLTYSSLKECITLWDQNQDCWLADLKDVLAQDHAGVFIDDKSILQDPQNVESVIEQITQHAWESLLDAIHASRKLAVLRPRYPRASGTLEKCFLFQPYLHVPTSDHRKSLVRLLTSFHQLSVETLRWRRPGYEQEIPRERRLCRFCRSQVEDELHAVFVCMGHPEIVLRRVNFLRNASAIRTSFGSLVDSGDHGYALNVAIDDPKLRGLCASFVHKVLTLFDYVRPYVVPNGSVLMDQDDNGEGDHWEFPTEGEDEEF